MTPHPFAGLLPAVLNSFVLDWYARQKVGGTHLSFFILQQLPVIPPAVFLQRAPWAPVPLGDWLRRYVAELCATASDMLPYARDLGWLGPPFRWADARRHQLRAEVDAAMFALYRLDSSEAERVLYSFWVVRDREMRAYGEFRSKRLILGALESLLDAGPERPFVSGLSPEPGAPEIAHPARDGTSPAWASWDRVTGRLTSSLAAQRRDAGGNHHVQQEAFASPVEAQWRDELAVQPSALLPGMVVRHRSHGEGLLLSVRHAQGRAFLLLRFSDGEKEIAFGHGYLEFQDLTSSAP
jgi:hypothetical protein